MNDTVVATVSAFFVIGILVGIIIVVAMSVLRAERRRDPADLLDDESRGSREPPGLAWDDTGRNGRSRWPGDADNDFSDR
jgi:MFS superfamily sulfate permease-like transporter